MKKSKIIAIVLAAAIMLMGAGYAAWSDSLNITTTATTGALDVRFIEGKILGLIKYAPYAGDSHKDISSFPGSIYLDSPYIESSAAIDPSNPKVMNVSFSNLFPGSLGLFTARVQNTGTIPAKFDKVRVEFNNSNSVKLDELKNNLMCAGGLIKIDLFGNRVNLLGRGYWNVPLSGLEAALNDLLAGIELEKGETITFDIPEDCKDDVAAAVEAYDPVNQDCMIFYLPSNTPNNTAEGAKASFKIYIDWKQFNK